MHCYMDVLYTCIPNIRIYIIYTSSANQDTQQGPSLQIFYIIFNRVHISDGTEPLLMNKKTQNKP